MRAKQVMAAQISEKDFQAWVVELAEAMRWRVFHAYDSRKSIGPGFPDLVLVRDRVLFVELKTTKGKVSPSQQSWADALSAAGAYIHVWRPSDMDHIEAILTARQFKESA